MPTTHESRQLLAVYADKESWKQGHDEAQACLNIEEKLVWGVQIFRGLLSFEGRVQARSSKIPLAEAVLFCNSMAELYQLWLTASEFFLEKAKDFERKDYILDDLDVFVSTVEEARCLCDNLTLEPEIKPIEEMVKVLKPNNPRPERYGD